MPLVFCVYGKIREQLALASQSQIWGCVRRHVVLLQNTSTTTNDSFIVYRNEIVYRPIASRLFKLTSEMESFLCDNTFQLFRGRASAPPLAHACWRPWYQLLMMKVSGRDRNVNKSKNWLCFEEFLIRRRVCCFAAVFMPDFSAIDVGGGVVNVTWYWPPTKTAHDMSHLTVAVYHRRHGTNAFLPLHVISK